MVLKMTAAAIYQGKNQKDAHHHIIQPHERLPARGDLFLEVHAGHPRYLVEPFSHVLPLRTVYLEQQAVEQILAAGRLLHPGQTDVHPGTHHLGIAGVHDHLLGAQGSLKSDLIPCLHPQFFAQAGG